jgi:hypothetical protein
MNMLRLMCILVSSFSTAPFGARLPRTAWRWAAAIVIVLAGLGLPRAEATTLARMDVRELTERASYVARVRCVEASSLADAGQVWTVTTFEVTEAWKGNPPARFIVRLPGGEAAGVRVNVEGAPRFAAGEEAVLFLQAGKGRPTNIISWAQGTFRIRPNPRTGAEEAVQDTAGLPLLDTRSGRWWPGGRRQIPLVELRLAVARAAQEEKR